MTILDIDKPTSWTSATSLCLGHFDGIHIAHKKLFEKLDDNGVILSIGIENSTLTPYSFRDNLIDKKIFGLYLREIKHLDAYSFFNLLKTFFPNFKKLIVGYDFKMGKDRKCDIECLKEKFTNIEIISISEIKLNGTSVHSHTIKTMIKSANIKEANIFLGRAYCISGNIISGQGIGAKELVPTINIENNHKFFLPKSGVYATKATINNTDIFAITFIGARISTDGEFAIETHILDSNLKIDNQKTLDIKFYAQIRNNIFFKNKNELKRQILKDIKKTKSILDML